MPAPWRLRYRNLLMALLLCGMSLTGIAASAYLRDGQRLVPTLPRAVHTINLIRARTPYHRAAPRGVAWAGADCVYVADANSTAGRTASIQAFHFRGDRIIPTRWFDYVLLDEQRIYLRSPVGAAVTSAGLWVADSDAAALYLLVHDKGADRMLVVTRVDLNAIGLQSPSDVEPGPGGGAYVLDGRSGAIARVMADGTARTFGMPELRSADGMGITCPHGQGGSVAILVAVGQRGSICKVPLSASGDPVPTKATWMATGLDRPTDVAVAPDGTVWVTQPDRHRVVGLLGGSSRVSTELSLRQAGGTALRSPWSIGIAGRGSSGYALVVADAEAGTVAVAEMDTRPLRPSGA